MDEQVEYYEYKNWFFYGQNLGMSIMEVAEMIRLLKNQNQTLFVLLFMI